MFSGIVEAVAPILACEKQPALVRFQVVKPSDFNDLKIGDSIAVNGACLTVEAFDQETMTFAYAAESLLILKIEPQALLGQMVNLERSLRFGDRIHGHLVTGHIEGLGKVVSARAEGESWLMEIEFPAMMSGLIWQKGSITLHGVSLTVNQVKENRLTVCLIPETLKRTNLSALKPGESVNLEPDYFAKVLVHNFAEKFNVSK